MYHKVRIIDTNCHFEHQARPVEHYIFWDILRWRLVNRYIGSAEIWKVFKLWTLGATTCVHIVQVSEDAAMCTQMLKEVVVGICKSRKTFATHNSIWELDHQTAVANFKTLSLLPSSQLPSSLLQFLPTIFVFKCVRMFHPGKWWTPRRVRVLCEVTNLGFVCWRDTIGYGEFTTAINPSTGSRWLHSALETRQYSGCHIFQSRRLWNNKLFNAPVNLSLLRQQHLKLSGSLFIVMEVENRVCFVDFVEEKQRRKKEETLDRHNCL